MDLAAVLAPRETVAAYLRSVAESEGPARCHAPAADRTLVIFEEATGDLDRMQRMSEKLRAPVIALHVHDDDLWMYEFYVGGELKDQFNPIPDYWDELSDEAAQEWRGDANVLASHWRNLRAEDIARYLVSWDSVTDGSSGGDRRAYATDQFPYGDFWQMCDFLKKLGTPYPEVAR